MTKKIKHHVWHKRSGTMIEPKALSAKEGKKGLVHETPSAAADPKILFARSFSAAIKKAVRE
jgi:hypothetical protein